MFQEQVTRDRVVRTFIAATVLFGTLFVAACPLFSNAKGSLIRSFAKDGVGLVDNQPDYGYTVTVVVRNVCRTDPIRIVARLNCDEGEWRRTQDVHFAAGETKTLNYFFAEPTVNASNCQYSVSVWPNASS
jgi:hypothetical protein